MDAKPPVVRRGRRGPYAKSEQTRRSILDAALEVFASSGYRGGSLRDIAQGVGISEAGLLHHFPSKAALLAAVLERRDDHSREQFAIGTSQGRGFLAGLVELAEYNSSIPGVVELFTTLAAEAISPEHPAHAYFAERYTSTRQQMLETLQALEDAGELRPDVDPAVAARAIIALMDGLQVQWLYENGGIDMAADLKSYLDSLLVTPL
ncbi:MAG: TetR/AcrR family transcriptional regulator [Microbacteriaceae bacterium]|nr:TetR/AcrR family transcriptional regulator [Microbacteriaceae bacterium]